MSLLSNHKINNQEVNLASKPKKEENLTRAETKGKKVWRGLSSLLYIHLSQKIGQSIITRFNLDTAFGLNSNSYQSTCCKKWPISIVK